MILKNVKLKCKCIDDYVFNKTDKFPGVQFIKARQYRFDKPDIRHKNTNLVAVINDDTNSYIGMSISTFNKHFIVILNSSDINNKKILDEYKINYKTED